MDDTVLLVLIGMLCLCSLLIIAVGLFVSYKKKWLFWSEDDPSPSGPSPSGPSPSGPSPSGPSPSGPSPATGPLSAWTDTFSGNAIDATKWTVIDDNVGVNQEKQFYRPDNVSVDKDGLHLKAKRQTWEGQTYTSGKVISKTGLKMGTVSVKCCLPKQGDGIWPAVWLLPRGIADGSGATTWPDGGEIDIMEWRGRTGAYASSAHWLWRAAGNEKNPTPGNDWMDPKSCHSLGPDRIRDCQKTKSVWSPLDSPMTTSDPHTWSVTWDANKMDFSLDGKVYHTVVWTEWFPSGTCDPAGNPDSWPTLDNGDNATTKKWNACNPFTSGQEWLVILNFAVGGVFDTVDGVQKEPPVGEDGPWDFVIKEVTVTPSG